MLMHSFFDWVCFVTDPTLQSGIMMSESVTVGLVLATAADIAIGIVGLYMIRPAMIGIDALGAESCNFDDEIVPLDGNGSVTHAVSKCVREKNRQLIRKSIRANIPVMRLQIQKSVTHTAANEKSLITCSL